MRRKDREISKKQCLEILDNQEYGTLATINNHNAPYIIPVNYVLDREYIYIHCAKDVGDKLDNIRNNKRICFNVVSGVELLPEKFTTKYKSVTVFGDAEIMIEGKKDAILFFTKKLSPGYMEEGIKYINEAIEQIDIIRIKIDIVTGKAHI